MNHYDESKKYDAVIQELWHRSFTKLAHLSEFQLSESAYFSWNQETGQPSQVYQSDQGIGGLDTHYRLQQRIEIEPLWAGKNLHVHVSTSDTDMWNTNNPQFLVLVNGEIIRALDINHNFFQLTPHSSEGDVFKIELFVYANTAKQDIFIESWLSDKQEEVYQLHYLFKGLKEAVDYSQPDSSEHKQLQALLTEMYLQLDLTTDQLAFKQSVKETLLLVEAKDSLFGNHNLIQEHVIGHTHIDISWLWAIDQTAEKAVRSFSNAVYLLTRYPEMKFMSSQPILYQFVKQHAPELYNQIKAFVKSGRWEVEGSMYLESDINLASGEALIRQIAHGKRFFKEEFNKENKVLWLPDVFGYTASLPQIMKKSGIEYFLTSKIDWNDTNKMPHDTFYWQGIDGSQVLTQFLTTADHREDRQFNVTYNGRLNASQVKGTWANYKNKEISNHVLQCYGFGDGGGGPTEEMLEYQRFFGKGVPGFPQTTQSFVRTFFETLAADIESKSVPKWRGELYLEYHRGVYTTEGQIKKMNRRAESLLLATEILGVISQSLINMSYPDEELDGLWQLLLINHFHDILPGTSIREVKDEALGRYQTIIESCQGLIENRLSRIGESRHQGRPGAIVFNPTSFYRNELIQVMDQDHQLEEVLVENIPPMGYVFLPQRRIQAENEQLSVYTKEGILSNLHYRVTLNQSGEIVQLFDKSLQEELIQADEVANRFELYDDRPWEYEAWNLEKSYRDKGQLLGEEASIALLINTALKTIIRVKRAFLQSEMEQDIIFYRHTKRIDFVTRVNWRETKQLLKVSFPLNVYTNVATHDIQFGNIERNVFKNTSWDEAKFEVCAHKFVDLSEPGYGVAVLNDAKYGHSVDESTISISLLRSTSYPNPEADIGCHEFTYALYPHEGDFRQGSVYREAYGLNQPCLSMTIDGTQELGLAEMFSGLRLDQENIICETIKLADRNDGIVVRLYESWGKKTTAILASDFGQSVSAYESDLLEENLIPLEMMRQDRLKVVFAPYEIKTILLKVN
ncbi:alpha-mannosidase [Vagococcus sp. BWB3-3]|uniref:Alpha-mannosidase n=1 Tax=Vagococcus allomyrinae TaxID=2794353 RepID=A0A940PC93_9ENTE|nr:glycoside hydrolase family 38 C-terminal domain-containing protein [Vagococcus allomyrinae]MBP1042145.1 alpha-mannosidase [Vagococcus allomyrinae]